jgi:hypothetical protein
VQQVLALVTGDKDGVVSSGKAWCSGQQQPIAFAENATPGCAYNELLV